MGGMKVKRDVIHKQNRHISVDRFQTILLFFGLFLIYNNWKSFLIVTKRHRLKPTRHGSFSNVTVTRPVLPARLIFTLNRLTSCTGLRQVSFHTDSECCFRLCLYPPPPTSSQYWRAAYSHGAVPLLITGWHQCVSETLFGWAWDLRPFTWMGVFKHI